MKKKTLSLALALFFAMTVNANAQEPATFGDVHSTDWFQPAVQKVVESGLMSGYGNGLFGPNASLQLDQVAQVMMNTAPEYEIDPKMLGSDYWAAPAVDWAIKCGLMDSKGEEITPQLYAVNAGREQAAAYLFRYAKMIGVVEPVDESQLELDPTASPGLAVELAQAKHFGIIKGFSDGKMYPKRQLTRAQFAQMLVNLLDLAEQSGASLQIKAGDQALVNPNIFDPNTAKYIGWDHSYDDPYYKGEFEGWTYIGAMHQYLRTDSLGTAIELGPNDRVEIDEYGNRTVYRNGEKAEGK